MFSMFSNPHRGRIRLDIGKHFFIETAVKYLNRLPREVEQSTSGIVQKMCGCGSWEYGFVVNTLMSG